MTCFEFEEKGLVIQLILCCLFWKVCKSGHEIWTLYSNLWQINDSNWCHFSGLSWTQCCLCFSWHDMWNV